MRTIEADRVRKILKDRKARWSIPDDLRGILDLEEMARDHALGGRKIPPSARLRRMPRFRAVDRERIRIFRGNLHPLLRVLGLLPASWDWRDVDGDDWITPIRSQGGCGSCVVFGVTAAVEAHWRIVQNDPNLAIDMSEASLFFAANRQCNVGDPAYGWHTPAALDMLVDQGVCDEVEYPYVGTNQTAQLVQGDVRTIRLRGYDSTSDTTEMKRWLVEEGPLIASYTVYQDFDVYWNGGANGVYDHTWGDVRGGHVVCVVGYDDTDQCWICKNSWGNGGDDGFFRIGYGEAGIDDLMFLPEDPYRVTTLDRIPYDPASLFIVDEGASGWLLTDGTMRMKMLDNHEDALNALRVARRHTMQCFIGRDNPRPNRRDYLIEYWDGNSGLPHEPLSKTDAISYSPSAALAVDEDAAGWVVTAPVGSTTSRMLMAHDMDDALAGLHLVQRHSRQCFIGRGNTRPDRKAYIMTYWE